MDELVYAKRGRFSRWRFVTIMFEQVTNGGVQKKFRACASCVVCIHLEGWVEWLGGHARTLCPEAIFGLHLPRQFVIEIGRVALDAYGDVRGRYLHRQQFRRHPFRNLHVHVHLLQVKMAGRRRAILFKKCFFSMALCEVF